MQNKRTSFQALILALFLSFSLLMAPLANAAFQTDKVYSTLSEKGVISDIDNFRPGDYCTRAEFYKMALSVAKIQADEAQKMPFKDVKLTQWYAKYIWTALNLGIIEASDKFGPNDTITQGEALQIILLTNKIQIADSVKKEEIKFKDINVNSLLAKYAKTALNYGMFKYETALKPNKQLTRLDAANLIYDFLTKGSGVIQKTTPTVTINVITPATTTVTTGMIGKTDIEKKFLNNEKFQILLDVLNKIDAKYVDQSKVNIDELLYGAVKGVVDKLDDHYTVFQEPVRASNFNKSLTGEFDGVGISLEMQDDKIVVITPLKNTPAEAAGIKPGDIITKVNGNSVAKKSLDEVVQLIQGATNTEVQITIMRSGKEMLFVLKRQHIKMNSVEYEMKTNVGYIEIVNFTNNTPVEFQGAIDALIVKNPKGFVIDLRNNPGGFLNSAIAMLYHFIPKDKLMMTMAYADQQKISYISHGPAELSKYPIYVLINQGSASAAEIMAAAIQEHGVGKLVGKASFGKGSVQELINYNDGSMLKITMAKWLTPSGKNLTKENPLKPDYEVNYEKSGTYDPTLDAAMSLINSK
ncbi:MAG: carboxyl-terminal protease, carboxyl-terminal processing protease [Candidatus Peregrinibacteria bacterium GW2011_GWC2_39_14]|nr:MAG: carboxyl-terminal protease, carboxyl-terminal processing protease [Candidatus Peregrinibacteria bacterium GW2011_GWC2_39_14]